MKGLGKSNNTPEKIKNGTYYNMFCGNSEEGNKVAYDMASLATDIHSASIKAGNELEKILEDKRCWGEETHHIDKNLLFNTGTKGWSRRRINKYLKSDKNNHMIFHNPRVAIEGIKTKGGKQKECEPDLILLTHKQVFVVEIKLGSNFDTSKSKGEREKLLEVCNVLKKKCSKGIEVTPMFVCWRCKDMKEASIKDEKLREIAIAGEEFANKFNVNKKFVDDELTQGNNARQIDVLERMKQIVEDAQSHGFYSKHTN